ncbi:hypothetical protein CYMTET_38659 [Cymbomonas tetramitiformis]|uniref:Uncharacterized protein n=1 Tax=Cymbomonas tetramitiformis TaxID=36881 RepID=A0AAE0CBL0_9CHLO|nr:hypothetical protein CYMTET_38659 [Cymbomonas tetramitiformis]
MAQDPDCGCDAADSAFCQTPPNCIGAKCTPSFRYRKDRSKCVANCSDWCENKVDCADDDDNQLMCGFDCVSYCVATNKCAGEDSRKLTPCEKSCAHFMIKGSPDFPGEPDPISYSNCVIECAPTDSRKKSKPTGTLLGELLNVLGTQARRAISKLV